MAKSFSEDALLRSLINKPPKPKPSKKSSIFDWLTKMSGEAYLNIKSKFADDTPEKSFERFLSLAFPDKSETKERLITEGVWTDKEWEKHYTEPRERAKDAYSFIQKEFGNPYLKIFKEGEVGYGDDINRPFYRQASDAEEPWAWRPDTLGIFEHNLEDDAEAEYSHAAQRSNLNPEETKRYNKNKKELLDRLGGVYNKLYSAGEGVEWEAHSVLEPIIRDLTTLITGEGKLSSEEKETFLDKINKSMSTVKAVKSIPKTLGSTRFYNK
jgi:hypothetical protein